jgi:hypothetical protein
MVVRPRLQRLEALEEQQRLHRIVAGGIAVGHRADIGTHGRGGILDRGEALVEHLA